MFDRWEYTIPANTSEENAVRVECKITKGFLRTLMVYFPPGCHGLARCRVFAGERPIAPRSAKNYVAADGMAVYIQYLNEPIQEDIPVLNWDVWNVDDTHDHTIWMSAEWLSEDKPYEMKMAEAVNEFVDIMKKLIGV